MNPFFYKAIDNQYTISDLDVEALTLNPTNLPADIGKNVGIDSNGVLIKRYPAGSNIITVKLDANDDSPYESTTLYGAVEKARTTYGTLSFENAVQILIQPGAYYETQQIILTQDDYYLTITGPLQYYVAQFYLTGQLPPGKAWFVVNCPGLELSDFSLDAQGNADHVLKIDVAGGLAGAAVDTFRLYTQHGNISSIWLVGGGIMYSFFSVVVPYQTSTYAILVDGASYLFEHYNSIFFDEYTDSSCIFHYVDNGSFVGIVQDSVYGVNNGVYGGLLESTYIVADNGSSVELLSGNIYDFNYIFKIFNGSVVTTRNIQISSTQYVNNAFDDTCLWTSSGDSYDVSKLDLTTLNANNSSMFYMDRLKDDDIGLHMLSNLIIGDKNYGSNCFIGQGGSNIQDTVILTWNGATFTDITSDLNEENSINRPLFTSLTAGIFYLGGDVKFASLVLNITGALVIGTANLILEYWNGASWVKLNFMASKSTSPYTSYAQAGLLTAELQVFRCDILLLQSSVWQKNIVNGINKYWIRYRIASGTMTLSPVVKYFKIIYSTTNIKPDGTIFHHGLARTLKVLPYDWSNVFETGVSAPQSQSVWYSTKLKLTRTLNKFRNGDTVNMCFLVPSDIDSSCKLSFRIAFFSSSSAAGQVGNAFELVVGNPNQGDQGYTAAPALVHPSEQTISFTLLPNILNGSLLKIQEIEFYLPTLLSSSSNGSTPQIIILVLSRTSATGSDPVISQAALYYTSYKTTNIVV